MSDHIKHTLAKDEANSLLNNVLDSCNIPPSAGSLNETMIKSALNRKPLGFLKAISIICMLLVVLSPLAFRKDEAFEIVTRSKTVAVSSHILYEDCFIITLTGDADYSGINAKKNSGAIIFPDNIDEATGLVIFPYDGDALNIYIPTKSGGCIQAVLNEKK